MEELDLAYVAGVIDSDGSICISRMGKQDVAGREMFSLTVSLGMAEPEVVVWLRQTFGGHFHVYTTKSTQHKYYLWQMYSRGAAEFLRLIRSYLRLKARQAQLGIKFQEFKVSVGHRKQNPRTQASFEFEQQCYEEMRRFHREKTLL